MLSTKLQKPLCFSAHSVKHLLPDPGLDAGLSVPVNDLPGPEHFLMFLSSVSSIMDCSSLLTTLFFMR